MSQLSLFEEVKERLTDPDRVLKVTKTDTILMEYVLLPIADLCVPLLYRFVEPVPTAWRFSRGFTIVNSVVTGSLDASLRNFAVDQWIRTLPDLPEIPPEAQWLWEINQARVIECKIIPKDDVILPYLP